jgi:hypothetical protein
MQPTPDGWQPVKSQTTNHTQYTQYTLMNEIIIKIATEIAENEVERRIGEWLAIEIDDQGDEVLTEEAQELFDEVYSEALIVLKNNLRIQ